MAKTLGRSLASPQLTYDVTSLRALRLVEFDLVAEVHALHGKNDHAGSGGRSGRYDHHLSHGAARQIAHMDHRASSLGQEVRVDGSLFPLRIFVGRSLE